MGIDEIKSRLRQMRSEYNSLRDDYRINLDKAKEASKQKKLMREEMAKLHDDLKKLEPAQSKKKGK